MKLIPIEDRGKYRCHFCGETRSVKYLVNCFDPVVASEPIEVACCNRCAFQIGLESGFANERIRQPTNTEGELPHDK